MSQLLERLQRELATLSNPVLQAEVLAKIAGLLARRGRFEDARQAIGHVQQAFGRGESGRVTVMKMISEALLFHYEDLSPEALKRVTGALALARLTGYTPGVALAAAWKAHIEFERSDFSGMTASLKIAMSHADVGHHEAWVRISAVLANSCMISGVSDAAVSWFRKGHEHASKLGDTESIDALLYNKAAFSVAWLRACQCTGRASPDVIAYARGEVNSARNLRHLAGVTALAAYAELMDARLSILERRYEAAITTLQRVRGHAPLAPHNFHQSMIDVEIAFCRVMQGSEDFEVLDRWEGVLADISGLDVDERLVGVWMLLELAKKQPLAEPLTSLATLFDRTQQEHDQVCANLRQALESVSAGCMTITPTASLTAKT